MWKLVILPIASLLLAVYLYPSSIVHTIQYTDIPSNPHYPYYLVLYPGETLVGTISKLPSNVSIFYVEIKGTIYDKWEPRVIGKGAFGNCKFKADSALCDGDSESLVGGAYIQASPHELFNLNSTDPIHLARAYEYKKDTERALSIYRALGTNHFFPVYRAAVISMDMTQFLECYHRFPHRKEPLYYLARYHRTMGNYSECLLYARTGMLVGSPQYSDQFVEKPIYQYALELEFAHCLYYSGRQQEAINQWKRVLPSLPEAIKGEIESFLAREEQKI